MSHVLPPPDEAWAPRYVTPSLSDLTKGPDVVDFASLLMRASRGFKAGLPLDFARWQSWLLDRLLELDPATGFFRHRRALIGLPRKNGKSLKGSAIALNGLVNGPMGSQVYSAAADRVQAGIVFNEAKWQVEQSQALSKIVKVYKTALEIPSRNAVYRALSADAFRNQGLGPYIVIADELHAWPSSATNTRGDELWAALTEGSGDRPESLVVGITTAGGSTDTLLGRLYEYGKRVANGEVEDPSFFFAWWEALAESLPDDREQWFRANPNLAEGLLDISDFEAALASAAGASGFAAFQRYRLNQWVRLAGEDFISPFHWSAAKRDFSVPLGAKVTVGFDGSVNNDATGIVLQDVETGMLKMYAVWEPDPTDPDWAVDPAEVDAAIHNVFNEYDVQMLWFDPAYFRDQGGEWAREYRGRVEAIPQSNQRVVPMAEQFLKDVVNGECFHDGNPALERHVLNAVATLAGSYKKEKPKSPKKIDLLACAVMANAARVKLTSRPRTEPRRVQILG